MPRSASPRDHTRAGFVARRRLLLWLGEPNSGVFREHGQTSAEPGRRQGLNSGLHMVAVTRMTHDPTTREYVEKRRAGGRSEKEIRRCIKRYFARRIYRTLNASSAT